MKSKKSVLLRIFADCLAHLCENNVNLILSKKMVYIKEENIYTRGYWDDTDKNNLILACCVTGEEEEWVPLFIHEYCHFTQYIDKCDIWHINKKITPEDMVKIFNNQPISQKQLESYLNATRDLELDCEKRVVKLLQKYNAPIDVSLYTKKANAYIWFHNHVKTYRSWYPQTKIPYLNKKIIKVCSDQFYDSYDIMPEHVQKAYESVYPSKKINNVY